MPIVTTPQTATGISSTTFEAEVAQYAAQIDNTYPPGPDSSGELVDFGADYQLYMQQHPQANPELVYETFLVRASALISVPNVIAKSVAAGAAATGAIGNATGEATSSLYPTWLQGFLGANGVLRIVEGVLGALIITVAIDKLFSGNAGIVSTAAKVIR